MTSHSDAGVVGFRRADIYDFLDGRGLTLNREAHAPNADEPELARSKEAAMPQNPPQLAANGFGERFTFSAIAAAKRAEFISYRETMTKLAESTGDPLKEIAAALKLHGIHENNMARLNGVERAVATITSSKPLSALLNWTIEHDEMEAVQIDEWGQMADPDTIGWMRAGLIDGLDIDIGIFSPETLKVPSTLAHSELVAQVPDWVRPYIGRRQILLGDVAEILAGFEPIPSHDVWGEVAWAKIDRWHKALIDAVGDVASPESEIAGSTWGGNRYSEQMLSHADIRAWCAKRGHVWPIPDPNPMPAGEAELIERLPRPDSLGDASVRDLVPAEQEHDPECGGTWEAKLALLNSQLKYERAEAERAQAELIAVSEKDVRRLQEDLGKFRKLNEQLVAEVSRLNDRFGIVDGASDIPGWMKPYIGQRRIAFWDVAKILAGILPKQAPEFDSDKDLEIREWYAALEEADADEELGEVMWSPMKGDSLALQANIRHWCAKRGRAWPIPDPNPLPFDPADRAELQARIDTLTAKLDATNAKMPASEPGDSISDKERASLQKQIAALALVLAEKSNKYKNGDKPNAKQIAEAVAVTLDAMPEANKHGVSSASLRASIKAGIEMLQGKCGGLE